MSKKNENNSENKKSNFIHILVVLLLIIAILMIIASLGFGGGSGNGNSGSGSSSGSNFIENTVSDSEQESSSEETETVPEETTESVKYIDITVSENTYNINGTEKSIDDIISTAKNDKNTVVRIKDDNAVVDTMDALISALSENNISYIEPTTE